MADPMAIIAVNDNRSCAVGASYHLYLQDGEGIPEISIGKLLSGPERFELRSRQQVRPLPGRRSRRTSPRSSPRCSAEGLDKKSPANLR